MTLHITYVYGHYVLQVSDRLVTRRTSSGTVQFDPEANKTIVYVARDAFISIGYSGRAYLDNRPTDQWIAEKLIGEEVGSRASVPGGGVPRRIKTGPTGAWHDIGSAMRLLREELIANRDLSATPRRDFPQLIFAGFQRQKRSVRPVTYIIADGGRGPRYQKFAATPRYEWRLGKFYLNFTPLNHRLRDIREELVDRLTDTSPTPDEAEHQMAQALRQAAGVCPEVVGKDYLSVLLPPPSEGRIRTRYVPFEAPAQQHSKIHENVPPYIGPVGFAPWIITPNFEAGPAVLVNTQEWVISGPLGNLVMEMEGPSAPPGTDFRVAIGSQARRPWSPR